MKKLIENLILFILFFLIVFFTPRLIKNIYIASIVAGLLASVVLYGKRKLEK